MRVPDAEIWKYSLLTTAEPSAAVDVNVKVCQPDSKPEGIVTDVLTEPLEAVPEPIV